MKKYSIIFAICLMSFSLLSCGKKSKIEDLRNQYIEACSDHNFEEARKALDKIEALESSSLNFDEHQKYVNEKEIYFLLANNSHDNANRIMYLYNTYEYSELPSMTDVLEVAISQGNEYLAKKLLQGGVEPDSSTVKATIANENNDLLNIVLKKKPDLILEEGVADFYCNENGQDALKKILFALWNNTESNNKYTRDKISSTAVNANISDFKDMLAKELTAEIEEQVKNLYSIKIPTCPAIGRVRSDHYGEIPEEYTKYKTAVEEYNSECLSIINNAIDNNLPNIAKRVLSIMKPNLEWNNLGDWEDVVTHSGNSSVYNAYMVKQNRTEIEEAQQLIAHSIK